LNTVYVISAVIEGTAVDFGEWPISNHL